MLGIIGLLFAVFLATRLYQTSSLVFDPYHYRFVASELAAVASGHYPLGGFVSQYTNLLPFLCAPALLASPFDAMTSVVIVTLILQVVTLAVSGWFVWVAASRLEFRLLGLLLLGGHAVLGRSYFQLFPIRLVVPMVAFAATWRVVRAYRASDSLVMVGLVVGGWTPVLVLNNPDFGLPASAALVAATVAVTVTRPRDVLGLALSAICGALAALALLSAGITLFSGSLKLGDVVTFARAFAVVGFFREPMAVFEPGVVLFPLGLISLTLGLGARSSGVGALTMDRSFTLVLMGTFQLLCLSYPLGRSYSTNFSAVLLPSIVMVVVLLDLLLEERSDLRPLRSERTLTVRHCAVAFVGLALAFIAGRVLPALEQPPAWESERDQPILVSYLDDPGPDAALPVDANLSGQLLNWATLIELDLGVDSLLVSNDPSSVTLITGLAKRQCEVLAATRGRVVMRSDTAKNLLVIDTCARIWNERGLESVPDSDLVILGVSPEH